MSRRKSLVRWFLTEVLQNKNMLDMDDYVDKNYYSPDDDIPFYLETTIGGSSGIDDRISDIKLVKGREPLKERLKIYYRTIFSGIKFSILEEVEEDGKVIVWTRTTVSIEDSKLKTNWMFIFKFSDKNGEIKILSIFAVYNLLDELVRSDVIEITAAEGKKNEKYIKYLADLGLIKKQSNDN